MKRDKYCLLAATMLALIASQARAACTDFNENFGQVKRFYSQFAGGTGPATLFQLKNGQTGALDNPTTSYYVVAAQTPAAKLEVYRTLTDFLIDSAKTGRTIKVRTTNCGPLANVAYIFADF